MYTNWRGEQGYEAMKVLIERHPSLDAVYCFNDQIAAGAIRAAQEAGRRIPEDVAILGHDNWDLICNEIHPFISSFDNDLNRIGRTAAHFLIDAINGSPHSGIIKLNCPLIVRESTERR